MPRKNAKEITSVSEDFNVTTGRSFSVRLTDNEKAAIKGLMKDMQERLPQRKLTINRLIRALSRLEGEQAMRALAKAIVKTW